MPVVPVLENLQDASQFWFQELSTPRDVKLFHNFHLTFLLQKKKSAVALVTLD